MAFVLFVLGVCIEICMLFVFFCAYGAVVRMLCSMYVLSSTKKKRAAPATALGQRTATARVAYSDLTGR